jgi:hypothetical protein
MSEISLREYLIAHAPEQPQWAWYMEGESRGGVEWMKQVCIDWPIIWADAIIERLKGGRD